MFQWAILRAFFRALFAFHEAGNRQRAAKGKTLEIFSEFSWNFYIDDPFDFPAKCMNRAFSSPGRRRSSVNDHLVK